MESEIPAGLLRNRLALQPVLPARTSPGSWQRAKLHRSGLPGTRRRRRATADGPHGRGLGPGPPRATRRAAAALAGRQLGRSQQQAGR